MSDQWVKPFAMNQICFCRESKDFVRLSNGTCTLDHTTPEAFAAAHKGGGCVYTPSEAVALRVVGINGNGAPIVACTYRKVRAEDLAPAAQDLMIDLNQVGKKCFIGRV